MTYSGSSFDNEEGFWRIFLNGRLNVEFLERKLKRNLLYEQANRRFCPMKYQNFFSQDNKFPKKLYLRVDKILSCSRSFFYDKVVSWKSCYWQWMKRRVFHYSHDYKTFWKSQVFWTKYWNEFELGMNLKMLEIMMQIIFVIESIFLPNLWHSCTCFLDNLLL